MPVFIRGGRSTSVWPRLEADRGGEAAERRLRSARDTGADVHERARSPRTLAAPPDAACRTRRGARGRPTRRGPLPARDLELLLPTAHRRAPHAEDRKSVV